MIGASRITFRFCEYFDLLIDHIGEKKRGVSAKDKLCGTAIIIRT